MGIRNEAELTTEGWIIKEVRSIASNICGYEGKIKEHEKEIATWERIIAGMRKRREEYERDYEKVTGRKREEEE